MSVAMKCDLCENPAVVHEVTVRNGVKSEIHLCETCARQTGVSLPEHKPIDQVLTQFVISSAPKEKETESESGTARKRRPTPACSSCGMKFEEFRQSGVLGCPTCYQTFERQLGPVIERAQNGGTTHSGKCPARRGSSIDHQLQIKRLVQDLEDAVSAEQFERAAELRDRLVEIESKLDGGSSELEASSERTPDEGSTGHSEPRDSGA